jgi:hypothetical protein
VPARDRDEHVHAAAAARPRERVELERVECLPREVRHLDHVGEGAATRVEVEDDLVGPVRRVAARRPRVQVDAPELDHPQEREVVVHERVLDERPAARARRLGARRDPVRHFGRRILDPLERAARHRVVPLHRERPVPQVRQQRSATDS